MLSGKVIIINHGLKEKQGLIKNKKAILKIDLLKRPVEKRRGKEQENQKLIRMTSLSHWNLKLGLKKKNLMLVMMIL